MSFTPELNRPVGSPEPTVNYKDPQHAEFLKFLEGCALPAVFQGYHDHLFHIYYTGWLKGVERELLARDTPALEKGKPENATGYGGCELPYYKSLAENLHRQQEIWRQERQQLESQVMQLMEIVEKHASICCSAKTAVLLIDVKQWQQDGRVVCFNCNGEGGKKDAAGVDWPCPTCRGAGYLVSKSERMQAADERLGCTSQCAGRKCDQPRGHAGAHSFGMNTWTNHDEAREMYEQRGGKQGCTGRCETNPCTCHEKGII